MSWFTPAELARAEAYHRRRFQAELVVAAVTLGTWVAVVAGLSSGSSTELSAEFVWPGSLALGVLAAALGFPFELAGALWRELILEPRHGLVRPDPVRLLMGPAVAAVVVVEQVALAVVRAVVVGAAAGTAGWWGRADPWVALAGVPLLAGLVRGGAEPLVAALRQRRDQVRPLAEGAEQQLLAALAQRARALRPLPPLAWAQGRGALTRRGEMAYASLQGAWVRIVVDVGVLAGEPALLEAVAAHELGHARALRPGLVGLARRAGGFAMAAALVGLVVRVVLDGEAVSPATLAGPLAGPTAGAMAALMLLNVVSAARSRRLELAADRFAAGLVSDPLASGAALHELLIRAGSDLAPRGLRRGLARYPGAEQRLQLLGPARTHSG